MLFSGRAYYNLLWLERLRGNTIPAHKWEFLDYRELDFATLFSMLHEFNIFFDADTFESLSEDADSPEEFIERVEIEDKDDKRKIYLIVFELWRRLIEDKESVSIFCDELDRIVAAYETEKDDEQLLYILYKVLEILERNTQLDEPPEAIFQKLSLYIAHDLENVIYTYIDSKLNSESEDSCIDLIDDFMPYVKEKRALKFLKLKSVPNAFHEEKEKLTIYIVSSLQEKVNVPLSISILFYLIEINNIELFSELFSFLIHYISEEKPLVSLLDVLVAYHRKRGEVEKQQQVYQFLQKRLSASKKGKISSTQKNKVLSFLYNN